jgi:hypothetical protein
MTEPEEKAERLRIMGISLAPSSKPSMRSRSDARGEPMKPQSPGGITESLFDTCFVVDCREVLRTLIAEGLRVQMCVTSPAVLGIEGLWYGGPDRLGAHAGRLRDGAGRGLRLVRNLLGGPTLPPDPEGASQFAGAWILRA